MNIKMFDNTSNKFVSLKNKKFGKYLNLLIDKNLIWKSHINYISNKISKTIGLFAKLRHYIASSTLLMMYKVLVQPYFSYSICIWGQAKNSNLNKLLVLQKKALKWIYFTNMIESTIPLFIEANVLPISLRMYDVTSNSAPPNICT
mgnify:CR=1 FL=1